MNNELLLKKFITIEDEDEIVKFLQDENLWDNPINWKYFGGYDNNFATISNQQSSAEPALVEKIVNSIDAILMKECKIEKIDPESLAAPKTLGQAVNKYKYQITPEDIHVFSTGEQGKYPNIVIADRGEGQSPKYFEDTLLSLNKSNKLRIPFVQGKFNMGSTGALPFCGKHSIQLILSKKHPDIDINDTEKNLWTFTIIRKNSSNESTRSSVIEYLVIDGKIPTLNKDSLNLLPDTKNKANPYVKPMYSGTFIKMFNYQLNNKGLLTIYPSFKISQLLPDLPFDIIIMERRKGFEKDEDNLKRYIKGNRKRLLKNKKLALGFPMTNSITLYDQHIKTEMFLFNRDKNDIRSLKENEGIVYILNGQVHGIASESIFNRKDIHLEYIYKNLLVYVDVTEISKTYREDMFMASRDRMKNSTFKKELEELILEDVKNNQFLIQANEDARKSIIKDKTSDNKHIQKSLQKIIKKENISYLFETGVQLKNPSKIEKDEKDNFQFIGLDEPSFFDLIGDFTLLTPKQVQVGKSFNLKFLTDAVNDLFTRDSYKADLIIENADETEKLDINFSVSLKNGKCNVYVKFPQNIKKNTLLEFNVIIKTTYREFKHYIPIKVIQAKELDKNDKKSEPKKNNSKLDLPEIYLIYKDKWNEHDFNEKSVLKILGNDYYLNADNVYILKHIKSQKNNREQILEEYKTILLMQGIAFQKYNSEVKEEEYKIDVEKITSSLAPVLFPIQDILEDLRK